jgi:hypothetical protein
VEISAIVSQPTPRSPEASMAETTGTCGEVKGIIKTSKNKKIWKMS